MNDYFASIVHAERMAEYEHRADSFRLAAAGARRRRSIALGGRVLAAILAMIALIAVLLIPGAI
jgi:hypothetical protein